MNNDDRREIIRVAWRDVRRETEDVMVRDGVGKYGLLGWQERRSRVSEVRHALDHIDNWLRGDDEDPDSGLSPLSHAIARLTNARDMEIGGIGEDDRNPQEHVAATGAEDPGHPDDLVSRTRNASAIPLPRPEDRPPPRPNTEIANLNALDPEIRRRVMEALGRVESSDRARVVTDPAVIRVKLDAYAEVDDMVDAGLERGYTRVAYKHTPSPLTKEQWYRLRGCLKREVMDHLSRGLIFPDPYEET